ncbi:DUF2213 domain-containing protein [Gluconobacter japonicus]|uniref:DUF2213 domain-containing protein n=1 Tax=Gluconobacter japonicus TaxID=376620 RepID=UPI000782B00A|nr:DUF2213 domain-containing protein [Gluconobacter japonicus]
MKYLFALDGKNSVRTIDGDGHLTISRCLLTKAEISGYYGREIPDPDGKLKLDPDKLYNLLRAPDELAKASSSLAGKPVLSVHKAVTSEQHDHQSTVGSVGTVLFEKPALYGSLSIWDGEAIERIESGEAKSVSCGYRYTPDMTPGVYEGQKYDGVMRDIRFNHLALVEEGRVSDAVIGDAKPITFADKYGLSRIKHAPTGPKPSNNGASKAFTKLTKISPRISEIKRG